MSFDDAVLSRLSEVHPNIKPQKHSRLQGLDKKGQQLVKHILEQENIYELVQPKEGAVSALYNMREAGILLYLVSSDFSQIQHQISWIENKIGKDWIKRFLLTPDKAILQGDILVDIEIQDGTCFHPKWRLVLLQQPFNMDLSPSTPRLITWQSWKSLFSDNQATTSSTQVTLPNGCVASFRHGSVDSLDVDMLYQFLEMPSHKDCLNFVAGDLEDKNIFIVCPEKHVVIECFKGIPDEVNNELFLNYSSHPQSFPCPITKRIIRTVPLRVAVALRSLLIRIRRIESVRPGVVEALQSLNFKTRITTLSKIKFSELQSDLDKEDCKYIAFHLGQTFALIQGTECFSKKAIALKYPQLEGFLYRKQDKYKPSELAQLDQIKDDLMNQIQPVQAQKKGDLTLLTTATTGTPSNFFHAQCQGIILDLKNEKLVFFPSTQEPSITPEWPKEQSNVQWNNKTLGVCFWNKQWVVSTPKGFCGAKESAVLTKFCQENSELKEHYSYMFLDSKPPRLLFARNHSDFQS